MFQFCDTTSLDVHLARLSQSIRFVEEGSSVEARAKECPGQRATPTSCLTLEFRHWRLEVL